jgi:ethanolamine utilization cobalamin adenosyltransferase
MKLSFYLFLSTILRVSSVFSMDDLEDYEGVLARRRGFFRSAEMLAPTADTSLVALSYQLRFLIGNKLPGVVLPPLAQRDMQTLINNIIPLEAAADATVHSRLEAIGAMQDAAEKMSKRENIKIYRQTKPMLDRVFRHLEEVDDVDGNLLFRAHSLALDCADALKQATDKKAHLEFLEKSAVTPAQKELLESKKASLEAENLMKQGMAVRRLDPRRVGPEVRARLLRKDEESKAKAEHLFAKVVDCSKLDKHGFLTISAQLSADAATMSYLDCEGIADLCLKTFDFLNSLLSVFPEGEWSDSFGSWNDFKSVFMAYEKHLESTHDDSESTFKQDQMINFANQLITVFVFADEWERISAITRAFSDYAMKHGIPFNRGASQILGAYALYLGGNAEELDFFLAEKKAVKESKRILRQKKMIQDAVEATRKAKEDVLRKLSSEALGVGEDKKASLRAKQMDPRGMSGAFLPQKIATRKPKTTCVEEVSKEDSEGKKERDERAGAASKTVELEMLEELTSRPAVVDASILDGTWNFTRSEFVTYVQSLGCPVREARGSHLVVSLPDGSFGMLMLENGEGSILTLPKWDSRNVPFYLRKQILGLREKIQRLKSPQ